MYFSATDVSSFYAPGQTWTYGGIPGRTLHKATVLKLNEPILGHSCYFWRFFFSFVSFLIVKGIWVKGLHCTLHFLWCKYAKVLRFPFFNL